MIDKIIELGEIQELIFDSINNLIFDGLKIVDISNVVNDNFKKWSLEVIPETLPLTININSIVYHNSNFNQSLIKEDLVTIDICFMKNGYIIDGAKTFEVETNNHSHFLDVARSSIYRALELIKKGERVGKILEALSTYIALNNYYLYPEGIGHGIGTNLHSKPYLSLTHYEEFKRVFKPGDVFTLEPILLLEKDKVIENSLGVGETSKNTLSAQFEVTVVIDEKGNPIVINEGLLK